MASYKRLQPRHMLTQFEVVVLLCALLDFPPFRAKLTVLAAFLIGEELLLAHTVIACVCRLVDLILIKELLKDGLNDRLVLRVRRCCPAIEFQAEQRPHLDKFLRISIGELLCRNALAFGRLLDFLTVLVHSGKKVGLLSSTSLVTRDDVS
jgi:hypothetical protein